MMRKGDGIEMAIRAVVSDARDKDRLMERAATQEVPPAGAGSGTVTSVALTMPAIFSVSGSPVTVAGTLAATLANQSANQVWAGPTGGGAAAPTFRSLVAADIPALSYGTGTVTSVALSLPAIFSVSGSPVTTTGTLTGTLANQTANTIWAGPVSGGAAAPAFRAMVTDDIPATIVTYAKIQNVTTARLLGRTTAGSGVVEEISVGAGLTLAAGVLDTAGGAGVTGSGTDTYLTRWTGATSVGDSTLYLSSGKIVSASSNSGLTVVRTGADAVAIIEADAPLGYYGQVNLSAVDRDGGGSVANEVAIKLASDLGTVSLIGNLVFHSDATNDIGASGANRARDAYLSRSLYAASIKLLGSGSGTATITPPAAAGTPTLTLPTASGTLALIADVKSAAIFAATASATVANTTTETSIVGTGTGSATLAAGFWTAGKTVRVRLWGYLTTAGSAKLDVRAKCGAVTILDTTSVASGSALSNAPVMIEIDLVCRTPGVSGTVMGQGRLSVNETAAFAFPALTAAVTVDTTASALLDVTAQWNTASAGETITITNVTIEALGV